VAHCAEARRVRRELDKELAETGARSGRSLVWTAADREVLAWSAIDRKCDLQRDYSAAEDAKTRVKVSAEIRLLENSISRMLRQIKTDTPAPESLRSIKARAAVMRRWHPDNAAG
jgi:hypothetical protein